MFNKRLKERIFAMEVVMDALISTLTRKKVITRDDIQKQILEQAKADKK